MTNKLTVTSRILVAFATGALVTVFFLPAWRIDLFAPQYPEGLTLNIWINGLSGDVDVINGLNHYIGMKHITKEMFPEFKFLPIIVGFFMALGMAVSITGRRKLLFIYLCLSVVGGILALFDFYKWGYDYGHNLDPTAPIQVPGLSYQPPIIGHKRLLNFDAYSFPDVGGWVVIGAGTLAFAVWFAEWYKQKKPLWKKRKAATQGTIVSLLLVFFLSACSSKPEPFKYGTDNCYFCKMGIVDPKYGGEVVTKKGKVYKFDDVVCMVRFLDGGAVDQKEIKHEVVINYQKQNDFIPSKNCSFLVSKELRSPMGSNAAAFSSLQEAEKAKKYPEDIIINWDELYKKLK